VEWRSSVVEPTIGRRRKEAPWGEGRRCDFFWWNGPGIDVPIVPQTIALSLVAPDWFFVEFADGATQFVLPQSWHDALNKHTALSVRKPGPTMVTSFSPISPASPLSPQPSHGLFSSPNPSPVFGHLPSTPGPSGPTYAGSPQFVPQPTYNITNVYNNVQQQQQPAPQENGTVQLLDGALKVAGALLPMLNGNGTDYYS